MKRGEMLVTLFLLAVLAFASFMSGWTFCELQQKRRNAHLQEVFGDGE